VLLANATNLHAPFIVGGLGMVTATIIATPHLTYIDTHIDQSHR